MTKIEVNKKLKEYAAYDPTKESKPISIKDLCLEIRADKLTLPIFQTYIRWNIDKSIKLFNFQLFGKAAVSPISINKVENKEIAVPQVSFIYRDKIDLDLNSNINSVNDGQQRLSCNYKAFIDHEDFKIIVLDLVQGKFIKNTGLLEQYQIPVGKLYNQDENIFFDFLNKNKQFQDFHIYSLLLSIRAKHEKYYYTVNYAKDLTEEEQREWFEVLNLAGTRVTGVQVHLTEMLVKNIDYYKEYSDVFSTKLFDYGFENLFSKKSTEISGPLAALNPAFEKVSNKKHSSNYSPIPSDVKVSLISKLNRDKIIAIFEVTLEALDKALLFIKNNNLKEPDKLDYINYLIGYFVYNQSQEISIIKTGKLIEWYNNIVFSLKGNGERRKMFDDLLKL